MKKTTTIITIALNLLLTNINAQTTIIGTSPIGYSVGLAIASPATATNVPIGTIGNGVTWNCSSLQIGTNPIVSLNVSSPISKPYQSDYPLANWHLGVTYLTSTLTNEFYNLNADTLVKYGDHVSGSSYEIYSNPEASLKFPFSFGNVYNETYAKTNYNSSGMVTSNQTGSVTLTYDGFGTLILPCGTFNNVARIKKDRTNSLGPTTSSYLWLTVPNGEQLLHYETNGGIKVNYVNNITTTSIQKNNLQNTDALIYPTITSNSVNIISKHNLNYYKIYNQLGEIVEQEKIGNKTNFILDLNLQHGLYFIELGDSETEQTIIKKIIIN